VPRVRSLLFPGRLGVAGVVLAVFLAVSTLTRLGLAIFNGDAAVWHPAVAVPALLIGLAYDLTAGIFLVLPFVLLAWLWPDDRARRSFAVVASTLASAVFFAVIFTAASEFVFRNEFSSRFNFIAVDYLIYTRESYVKYTDWAIGDFIARAHAAVVR